MSVLRRQRVTASLPTLPDAAHGAAMFQCEARGPLAVDAHLVTAEHQYGIVSANSIIVGYLGEDVTVARPWRAKAPQSSPRQLAAHDSNHVGTLRDPLAKAFDDLDAFGLALQRKRIAKARGAAY